MGDRQHKIQFADTLRGIAAALVMLDHVLGLAGLSPTAKFPLLSLGQFGVALFFLVSGFVIPISLPKYSVVGFLTARVFRIYLTSIAAFAIALVVADKIGTAWSGAEAIGWYRSSAKVRRGFCSVCGSSLFFDPPELDWIGVAMGAFDGPTETHLAVHIFVADKGDYYDIADGLPQNQH
jgi:peptidoglycan/LPS O-acetylase OafA/YrhL